MLSRSNVVTSVTHAQILQRQLLAMQRVQVKSFPSALQVPGSRLCLCMLKCTLDVRAYLLHFPSTFIAQSIRPLASPIQLWP